MNRLAALSSLVIWFVLFPARVTAQQAATPAGLRLAALALPVGPRADWQQWDSFLTFVVKRLGQDLAESQKEQIGEVFLDARYQLLEAIRSGSSDPVPRLFLDTWERLSPIVKEALPGVTRQTASQYTSFMTAMESISSLGGVAQRLGLFRVTPDALRGAAGLLGTAGVDPLTYTLEVDSGLRSLLGFVGALPVPKVSPALEQSRLRRPMALPDKALAAVRAWLTNPAFAADVDFDRLNQWVPESQEVRDYLIEVRKLLSEIIDKVRETSSLPPEHQQLYRQIVLTTAWQESCWRQFVKKGRKVSPLASTTGDVGLMQVNRITWRSMYDVKGLNGDIGYNGQAGAEILNYYLTRYAIRRKEDKQPGGHLARATYSAYNGGPGALRRYRGVRQSTVWKKVDDAFWAKFQAVSSGQELAVSSCYNQ